ncbi:kinesin-like protein KIF25 [Xyrichtys novacula]|uniref:Kinesin-like protein KIF25 n=1 Tax=Xyrichtys novacula TaxID=13765 RepID=A0AAV1GY08_XYRNO|nr:kinesin-like protein KIF25 [Xyrichtys novacula]
MPLFINRDQMFAHQVHLLEHKLRSKEERILELETENAILHLRLAECLGKLRREPEEDVRALTLPEHQRNAQKMTRSALFTLLSGVQAVKQELSELFAVYLSFATELEEKSKQLLEKVEQVSSVPNGHHGDGVQDLQAHVSALERSLEEERERCRAERQRRKNLHNTLVELRGNIRVHCRVRPVLHFDHVESSTSASGSAASEEVVTAFSDDTVMVNCLKTGLPVHNKMFEFERVHGPEDSQDAVFEEVKPLLTSLLDGYNVCIMAYGQTGSGKTHTMMGPELQVGNSKMQQETQQGIISKAAEELFRLISEKPAEIHTVEVSVMEVYNNEVFDLLARDELGSAVGQRRDIITTSSGTIQVTSLTHLPSISQAPFKTKLQLVDLAGSECVGMSGVSGAALWEVSCINRSLSALADVLGALAEQSPHIPYRNSKLTHLLQDAIGGDSKLLLMLCVSPTQKFITESLQCLGLGTRVRQVQKEQPRRKGNTLRVK